MMKIALKQSSLSSCTAHNTPRLCISPLHIGFLSALLLHLLGYLFVSIPPLSLPSPFLFPEVEVSRMAPSWILSQKQPPPPAIPTFVRPPAPTLDELFPLPISTAKTSFSQKSPSFRWDPREVLSFLPSSQQYPIAVFVVSGSLASTPILEKPLIPKRPFPTKLPVPHFFSYLIRVNPTTGRLFWFAPLAGESNPWVEEQLQYFRFSPPSASLFSEGIMEVTLYP